MAERRMGREQSTPAQWDSVLAGCPKRRFASLEELEDVLEEYLPTQRDRFPDGADIQPPQAIAAARALKWLAEDELGLRLRLPSDAELVTVSRTPRKRKSPLAE